MLEQICESLCVGIVYTALLIVPILVVVFTIMFWQELFLIGCGLLVFLISTLTLGCFIRLLSWVMFDAFR